MSQLPSIQNAKVIIFLLWLFCRHLSSNIVFLMHTYDNCFPWIRKIITRSDFFREENIFCGCTGCLINVVFSYAQKIPVSCSKIWSVKMKSVQNSYSRKVLWWRWCFLSNTQYRIFEAVAHMVMHWHLVVNVFQKMLYFTLGGEKQKKNTSVHL